MFRTMSCLLCLSIGCSSSILIFDVCNQLRFLFPGLKDAMLHLPHKRKKYSSWYAVLMKFRGLNRDETKRWLTWCGEQACCGCLFRLLVPVPYKQPFLPDNRNSYVHKWGRHILHPSGTSSRIRYSYGYIQLTWWLLRSRLHSPKGAMFPVQTIGHTDRRFQFFVISSICFCY